MLIKTRGIYLNQVKYNDNGIIARIYTGELGMKSFLIKKSKGKTSVVRANILHPLSRLELVISVKEKSSVSYIKEMKAINPGTHIPSNIINASIALFLGEILYKCIREEEKNHNLFIFLESMLPKLENSERASTDFHLIFLALLTEYLGFSFPQTRGDDGNEQCFFDLKESRFTDTRPLHPYCLEKDVTQNLRKILSREYSADMKLNISNAERKKILAGILEYYSLHMDRSLNIKSHHILENILGS